MGRAQEKALSFFSKSGRGEGREGERRRQEGKGGKTGKGRRWPEEEEEVGTILAT